jgi:hypothetical protein
MLDINFRWKRGMFPSNGPFPNSSRTHRFIVTLGTHAKGCFVFGSVASHCRRISVKDLWSGSLNHASINSSFSTVIKTPASARVSHCSFSPLARQCGGGCQPHSSHRTQTNSRWDSRRREDESLRAKGTLAWDKPYRLCSEVSTSWMCWKLL